MKSAIERCRMALAVAATVFFGSLSTGPANARLTSQVAMRNMLTSMAPGDISLAPAMPESLVLPASAIAAGADVGYLPADWNVSDSGNFTYTVPLRVPDGRAGMQPTLSLSYSSSNVGNGTLGVGWSISGLSSITPCGRSLTVDNAVDNDGRFCLDGAKLIAVSAGISGAPYEYRTENEPYSRITVGAFDNGKPKSFLVETKSGIYREYEWMRAKPVTGTKSTFIASTNPNVSGLPDAPANYSIGEPVTAQWLLRRERDRHGNAVEYLWSDADPNAVDPDTGGVEVLLNEIRYTSKVGSPSSNDAPFRKVVFEYEAGIRPDREFSWRRGIRTELRHRLKKVTMHAPNPSSTAPVWTYLLTYDQSPHSGRSRLKSVQHCGLSPSPLGTSGQPGGCLWKKEFQWYDTPAAPAFVSKPIGTYPLLIKPPSFADSSDWTAMLESDAIKSTMHVLDMDGNGSDDIIIQYGSPSDEHQRDTFIRRGVHATNGAVSPLAAETFFDGDTFVNPNGQAHRDYFKVEMGRPVDLDGDGKMEMLAVREVQLTDNVGNPNGGWSLGEDLYEWSNETNTFAPTSRYPFGVRGISDAQPTYRPRRFNLLDLDGDRLLDAVVESDQNDTVVEDGPAFRWWANTWTVWMNKGGVLTKGSTTDVETRCPAQVTDADGDGRGELVQRYDENAIWSATDPGTPKAWAYYYDLDAETPGYKQYECAGIAVIGAGPGGTVFYTPQSANPKRKDGAAAAKAKRVSPKVEYGDFNGDGLEDELVIYYDGAAWQHVSTAIRWNTGKGYGPYVPVSNLLPPNADANSAMRVSIADMNGDGRDDVLQLLQIPGSPWTSFDLWLSQGNGQFTQSSLGFPGYFDEADAYTTTRTGDFNADGFPDIVRFNDATHLEVLEQAPHFSDRLKSIRDEGTLWEREVVEYSTRWSDKPEPVAPCAYPLACGRRGFPVVRSVATRAHLADVANPNNEVRKTFYSYEDPVSDLRGRGSLGFRKFRIWDPARPIEIVQEKDNRTQEGGKYYPGIASPTKVTSVVPFAWPQGGGPTQGSDPYAGISTGTARVVRSYTHHAVKSLNGGLTYDVHPDTWQTKEWEEPVTVDWGMVDAPSNPTSEHIFNLAEPATALRTRQGSMKFDDYGNATEEFAETVGGVATLVSNAYANKVGAWQLGQLTKRIVVRSEADGSPGAVARTTEFEYDPLYGDLKKVFVEKGNPDPTIPLTTSYSFDADGNLRGVEVTAQNSNGVLASRSSRFEFAPMFSGQPNERVYVSQAWAPYDPLVYRPSAWTAVHPAYGQVVAVMDVNGVQAQRTYDDLGRLLTSKRDGSASTSIVYAARPDTGGGTNGLVVTASTQGQTAIVEADALGRPLREIGRGFDGSLSAVKYQRDKLGRIVWFSKPYPQAGQVGLVTNLAYDGLDRELKVVRPEGTTLYDPQFFSTTVWDAENNKSKTERDVDDRLARSLSYPTVGAPITTSFSYGPQGVEDVTDAKGNKTHTEYDLLGRPVLQSAPDTGVSKLAYTGFGEIKKRTSSNGDATTNIYDALGRLLSRSSVDGTSKFVYDATLNGIGKLTEATSPDSVVSRWTYDAGSGRSTGYEQVVNGTSYRLGQTFDSVGRLTGLSYPSIDGSSNPGLTQAFTYNAAEYLEHTDFTPKGQAQRKLWQVSSRDLRGALLKGTIGPAGVDTINVERTYEWQSGRLDTMLAKKGNTLLFSLDYDYYKNGLVSKRSDALNERKESFSYDPLLRLTRWTLNYQTKDRVSDYAYDEIGNLLSLSTGVYSAGQVPNAQQVIESNAYSVNGAQPHTLTQQTSGNVTEKYFYDSRGRQTEGGGRKNVFTDFDLPKSITKGGKTWTFAYDAFGQRVKKSGPEGTTVYVGDAYEKRTGPGTLTKHVFHLAGTEGQVAEVTYDSQTQTFTTQYLVQDMLGSNSLVLDANGNIVSKVYFEPFGKRINADGSVFASPMGAVTDGFTGHEHDDVLGLINMRGRVYDAKLRRFLSADPFVTHPSFGQSWNSYSYVLNNPLNLTDPSGYQDKQTCVDTLGDDNGGQTCYSNTDSGGSGSAPGTEDDHCETCDDPTGESAGYSGNEGYTGNVTDCQTMGCVSSNPPGTGKPTTSTPKSDGSGAGGTGGAGGASGDSLYDDAPDKDGDGGARGAGGAPGGKKYSIGTFDLGQLIADLIPKPWRLFTAPTPEEATMAAPDFIIFMPRVLPNVSYSDGAIPTNGKSGTREVGWPNGQDPSIVRTGNSVGYNGPMTGEEAFEKANELLKEGFSEVAIGTGGHGLPGDNFIRNEGLVEVEFLIEDMKAARGTGNIRVYDLTNKYDYYLYSEIEANAQKGIGNTATIRAWCHSATCGID